MSGVQVFVGIDCGFTGGIAALIDGQAPIVWSMPVSEHDVVRMRKGRGEAKPSRKPGVETELDDAGIRTIMEELRAYGDVLVMVEKAQVRPSAGGKAARVPGIVSQAKFYGQFTEIRGILSALLIPFEVVHAATWKAEVFKGQGKASDSDGAKEVARQKAIQMFPAIADKISKKKDHGPAEALLIAWYARRRHGVPF